MRHDEPPASVLVSLLVAGLVGFVLGMLLTLYMTRDIAPRAVSLF